MNPKIKSSFWSDSEVEALTPQQKLTYLWLITNAQMKICGFCEVSERRFSFETGLDKECLINTVKALPRALKHFPSQNIVYVRNFIRHQIGDGDQLTRNNIFKSVVSVFKGVDIPDLRNEIVSDYPILKDYISPSKPSPPHHKGKGEGEGEGKSKGEGKGEIQPPLIPQQDEYGLDIPQQLRTPAFQLKWREWIDYRKTVKKSKDWVRFFQRQLDYLDQFPEETAIAILNKSLINEYQGLTEPERRNSSANGHFKPDHRAEKAAREFPETITPKIIKV